MTEVTDTAQRIHLTETPPVKCSSCFQQQPQARHVDFSAFWDGPVFNGPTEGVVKTVIDDLILCEDCITHAAHLVGLDDVEREREEIQRLKKVETDLRKQLTLALSGGQKLEQAQADIAELVELVKPKQRQTKARAA
jgi:hypothetical protein